MRTSRALNFIILLGIVSLFADMTDEGARSAIGPFLGMLGASAFVIGVVSGGGELVGYALRLWSGRLADRTRRYWAITFAGYALNLLAVPLLALAGNWQMAAALVILERTGKALHTPARDAMLSYATKSTGRGWGFGLHEALDQIGATIGPLLLTVVIAQRSGDKANGVPIAPHQLTFGEAVTNVKAAKAADGKEVNYAYDKHLLPFFGARTKMSAITTPKIREYIARRKAAGVANATVNRELEALSFAFTLAIQDGVLQFKPFVPQLDENNTRTGFFERPEYEALVAHLPAHLGHAVTFGYITGWRLQEVLTLRWRNVDVQRGEVRLDPGTTKNGEGRTFPLSADLRALLEKREKIRQCRSKNTKVITLAKKQMEFVFTRKNGAQIKSFRKWWWRACRAIGIPDRVIVTKPPDGTRTSRQLPGRVFHDLRRTAVRNLVKAGVAEKVAMQLTGHKTRSVFDRYHIVSAGDLREAVQKLEAAQ